MKKKSTKWPWGDEDPGSCRGCGSLNACQGECETGAKVRLVGAEKVKPISVLRTSVAESVIQERLLLALQARGIFAFPIPNHGKKAKGRNRYNVVQRGHVNGVPDIAICLPRGGMLWVELKSAKGVQSDDQKKVEARLTALGHTYLLARDWVPVVDWLRERGYLN